ncbi:MAG: phosphatidate cytidylyltransferase [Wenzhouxiangellaceae bacterium]|nr:phosphatidate cytidylyltransferase [Wenzhouxiangellaceae bacterium]
MLELRIITSVVLALVVGSALLLLPPIWLTPVLALLLLGVGGWEAAGLAGLAGTPARLAWCALLGVLAAAAIALLHQQAVEPWLLAFAAALWLVWPMWLARPVWGFAAARSGRVEPLKLLLQALILIGAVLAIAWLHVQSPWWVIWLLLVVAGADVGAYFSGMAIGGAKLAPSISPGKTWAGVFGGLLISALVAMLAARVLPEVALALLPAAVLALILAPLSVCGDLLFSLLKRQRGLKDTSALLPGHGGLLDRIDGLVAAAPFCALAVWWLGQ